MDFRKTSFILLSSLLIMAVPVMGQKKKKKDQKEQDERPEWVVSRPVNNSYYQGIGVAMVNNYTQGHVEEAKKKALNDLISEISVTVKYASIMHQIEQNDELNNMYQSLTNVTAENSIEGYELVDSWGNEEQYWVYYRLSKEAYHANKLRKLDRAKSISSNYYESSIHAQKSGDINLAYRDCIKGLASMKEYVDEEITILTDNGKKYLVDALVEQLMDLNRNLTIQADPTQIKTKVSKSVDERIKVTATYNGRPADLVITGRFVKGGGDVIVDERVAAEGVAYFKIQRITGGAQFQELEFSVDVEGMSGEEEGDDLMSKLIRLKTNLPSALVNVENEKLKAYLVVKEKRLGKDVNASSLSKSVKNQLAERAYNFVDDEATSDITVTLTIDSKSGEELPLKNKILYNAYVDMHISVKDRNGKELLYKGFAGEKGSRTGGFDAAVEAAQELALAKFESEILPTVNELDN